MFENVRDIFQKCVVSLAEGQCGVFSEALPEVVAGANFLLVNQVIINKALQILQMSLISFYTSKNKQQTKIF